jgi:glycosyltransferase involved in cell wall biosynthesis
MRIVFVTASLGHGGAERHSIALMNGLAARGHECHAVYIKNEASQLDRIAPRGAGTVRCLSATRYLDFRALNDFAVQLQQIRPTVVVAANAYALTYAMLARHLAVLAVPLLVTFHATKLVGIREHIKMLAERFFFWAADCLVYVCAKQRTYWSRRAVFARRVEVIHNGIDTRHFQPDRYRNEAQRLRQSFGFSADDYVIGMMAVLRTEKNPLQLLSAVVKLRRCGIPAKALLIGDGPLRAAVEDSARTLCIADCVHITGLQDDVRPYLAACDVLANCSTTEALSLAAIEAMAMARPVVHSNVGGAGELITPGHNGFLFPVGDTNALVDKLAYLAERSRAQAMGRNARAVVQSRFSESTMLDRYESVLLELCNAAPVPSIPSIPPVPSGGWASIKKSTQPRSEIP